MSVINPILQDEPLSKSLDVRKINKQKKVNYYGIEVEPEITWKYWRPGKKYIKKLVLKNVYGKTLRLNYSVPQIQVFSTTYPKTITLSSGTSISLPITFQPDDREFYEDKMLFQTLDGKQFTIPVRALLPEYSIEIPEDIWCGITAAHDEIQLTFTLTNLSELETPFQCHTVAPFALDPAEGELTPFGKITVTVTFQPKSAQTFEVDSHIAFGDRLQYSKKMKLRAIAKYPQVVAFANGCSLDNHLDAYGNIVIDFGTTSVNKPIEKLITIQNPSEVGASVEVFRADDTHPCDWVFHCPLEHSPIPPKSNLNVLMSFTPKITWTRSVENFTIIVSKKCGTMNLVCVGQSDGPAVTLSRNHINFFQLDVGESTEQCVEVINESCATTTFQFVTDPAASVFHFSAIDGSVAPHEKVRIIVTFRPQKAIQYLRRIVCLVPDQDPIFLELMGTCHDLDRQPHILLKKHSERFELRRQRGLSYFPPEELQRFLMSGKLGLDGDGALMLKEAEELEALCEPIKPLPAIKEYFYAENDAEETYSVPLVAVDLSCVDFNGVSALSKPKDQPYERSVCIVNNAKGPLLIHWTQPHANELGEPPVFRIEPNFCTIPAGKTVTAKVVFFPNQSNKTFSCELEGFAQFKSQRDYSIVHEEVIAVPFCLTVRCIGHTFTTSADRELFLPRCQLDRREVVFPSVQATTSAFRSIVMENRGNDPVMYHLQNMESPFAVKPRSGVLLPNRLQIFTLRCEPNAVARFSSHLEIQLNHRPDSSLKAAILGSSDNPEVFLPNNAEIYFSPTNVGNCSQRMYAFKNISRLPLKFEWKIPERDQSWLSVEPLCGTLTPNEFVAQKWTLYPPAMGQCLLKPMLIMHPILPQHITHEAPVLSYPIRIIGCGQKAELRLLEGYVDFGTVVVGSSARRLLTLVNDWPCAVNYHLSIVEEVESPYSIQDVSRDPCCLELSFMSGTVPGRCRQILQVTVMPRRRASYRHRIEYELVTNHPGEEKSQHQSLTGGQKQHLCHLISQGVFPTLRIVDIQGLGGAQSLSKRQLWNQFSLDNLNVCLDADPTSSEVLFSVATRQSYHRPAPTYTRAILDLNFGAAPLGAECTQIHIMIENSGNVDSSFHFLMPHQLQLELEYWAESGEYTDEQLHQLKVQENYMFSIVPHKAILKPGESQVVCFRYLHDTMGTDRLPVLLKIAHGREIMLNFIGVTVEPGRPYIHFTSRKHTFPPTSISSRGSPLQIYELYNGGNCPVSYSIDVSGLEQMREDNYEFYIMECINPQGVILPGQTALVQWKFNPLEARTYSVEIPIRINDAVEAVVTFTGIGYDDRQLGHVLPITDGFQDCGAPSQQAIALPQKIASLSEERLSFGNVALFSRTHRIIFINNKSMEKTSRFAWNVTRTEDSQVIHINPSTGVLNPLESCLCVVTFAAVGVPSFYDMDLICEIFDEESLRKYNRDVLMWKAECKRRSEEFTITEDNLEDYQDYDKFQKEFNSKFVDPFEWSSGNGPWVNQPKYRTLPPIKDSGKKLSSMQLSRRIKKKTANSRAAVEEMPPEPAPPKPAYLHLGITGRSHTIEEFQANFPDDWPKQIIDRSLLQASKLESHSEEDLDSSRERLVCTEHETHVVETTLCGLIRGLLSDQDFVHALSTADTEPIPYFTQFPEALKNTIPIRLSESLQLQSKSKPDAPVDAASLSSSNQTSTGRSLIASEAPSAYRRTLENQTNRSLSPEAFNTDSNVITTQLSNEDEETEKIKENPTFSVLVNSVFENMISNILAEANASETDITARPRLIALPPRLNKSSNSNRSNNVKLVTSGNPE